MYREKIYGVLVKVEATSGIDAAPAAGTDAVKLVGIPTLNIGFLEPGLRDDVVSGNLGVVDRTAPAGRFGTIALTLELKGAGAAYAGGVKPESDALWRMAGFGVTTDFTGGAEYYRYASLDGGMETGTVYCYGAGKLFKLIGCVAAPKFGAEANKRGLITFTVTGRIATDPTEVALPALTLSAVLPPLFFGGANNIGGWASTAGSDPLVVRRAEIDWGTQVSDRPSAGASDGIISYIVTDRKPRQTMLIEVGQLASFDAYAMSKAVGAGLPSSAWQIGTVLYNRVKVVTGRWALESPGHGADRSIMTWNLQGNLVIGSEGVTGREAYVKFD